MAESIKVALELDDRGYQSKLNSAIDSTKKLGTEGQLAATKASAGFDRLASSADMAISRIKGLVLAFVGLQAIASALQLADELSDLSKATDISIQKIIALQGALQSAGGNGEDASRMIQALINNLDGAAQGSADAQYQLMKLGFSFKDMTNLSPEQALEKTIAALAKMTNPIERNALAFQLLGKSARGINWDEVNQKLAENAGRYDEAAAAAKRAADVYDRFEASTKATKIALMTALDPLIDMVGYFDKLAGGGQGSFALNAFKTIFQAVAVLAANIGFVIKTIVDDVGALFQAGKKALTGNFSEAGDILKGRAMEAKAYREELDRLEERIFKGSSAGGTGQRMSATQDPRSTLFKKPAAPGSAPAAPNAMASQIDAINQIGDAYAKANARAREKMQLDYDLAGSSDEFKKIMEETARITNDAADKIQNLKDRLKNLTPQQRAFGLGKAIQDTIKAIEQDRDKSIAAAQAIIVQNEERIRSINDLKAAYDAMTQAQMAGNEQFLQAQTKMKDAEDARRQALMGPVAKALDQIRIEEEKLADARRKAELATGKYTNAEGEITQAEALAEAYKRIGEQQDQNTRRRQDQATQIMQEQATFAYGWDDAFKKYAESAMNAADQARSYFQTFTRGIEDAFVNFAQTGKLSFKSLIDTMIAEFIRFQVRSAMTNAGGFFGNLFGFMSGGAGGGGGLFGGKIIPGFLASGGPAMPNMPYIVGEKGPELFVPKNSGTIIPNNELGVSGGKVTQVTNVNYSIQAVDASSFRQLVARDPQFIYAVTEKGRRSTPTRRA